MEEVINLRRKFLVVKVQLLGPEECYALGWKALPDSGLRLQRRLGAQRIFKTENYY